MPHIQRRQFGYLAVGLAGSTITARANASARTWSGTHQDEGLTFTAEAIHQEISFTASRTRLYAAFLDAKQFADVQKLGVAMHAVANMAPPEIGANEGDGFLLFNKFISGRHIELVPDTRIVQAWREHGWPEGQFSLVRFAFADDGHGTKLTFDHAGFPAGAGHHLSIGWYEDYWQPLEKYLG